MSLIQVHFQQLEVVNIVCSGKDQMLPSGEEAKRLKKAIPGCRVRYFKESGHTLLLVSAFVYYLGNFLCS
jgi:hypothetical protein